MAGIRKTMRYILVLNKEIGILEGGKILIILLRFRGRMIGYGSRQPGKYAEIL